MTTPPLCLPSRGPNAIRTSRRHTAPRTSAVINNRSARGWTCTLVTSASCTSVPWPRLHPAPARQSRSTMVPSLLYTQRQWPPPIAGHGQSDREKRGGRDVPGAQEYVVLHGVARHPAHAVLRRASASAQHPLEGAERQSARRTLCWRNTSAAPDAPEAPARAVTAVSTSYFQMHASASPLFPRARHLGRLGQRGFVTAMLGSSKAMLGSVNTMLGSRNTMFRSRLRSGKWRSGEAGKCGERLTRRRAGATRRRRAQRRCSRFTANSVTQGAVDPTDRLRDAPSVQTAHAPARADQAGQSPTAERGDLSHHYIQRTGRVARITRIWARVRTVAGAREPPPVDAVEREDVHAGRVPLQLPTLPSKSVMCTASLTTAVSHSNQSKARACRERRPFATAEADAETARADPKGTHIPHETITNQHAPRIRESSLEQAPHRTFARMVVRAPSRRRYPRCAWLQ